MDSYAQTIRFLYDLRLFGAKFGLENTRKLAAHAGDPQAAMRFIHVAGTNGKGSTCAMLEGICRAAGWRVGLFTSPHLVSFTERIQVDREPIAEADVVRLVRELGPALERFPRDHHPTFFEVVTVVALRYFAERACDLVVWETGLGGRLDATNIVTPLVSVITNVQLDHQVWLGDTLAQIAAEKAGIIKPGVPAVTSADVPEALDVIRATARRLDAPLRVVTRDQCDQPPLDRLELPLAGAHQRLNAALALAALDAVRDLVAVPPEAIVQGLSQVRWPGRFHVLHQGGLTFVLDGAHNPAGAGCLRAALAERFPHTRPTLVLGILRDKDWTHMCDLLAPLGDRILLLPVGGERTAAPEALADACRHAHPRAEVRACANLDEALAALAPGALVVVAGSLYLVGEALQRLGNAPEPVLGRALNEWQSGAPVPAPAPPPAPGPGAP